MLRASSKDSGCRVPGRSADKTPAVSRHRCARASSWRRRPSRWRLTQRVGASAAVGLAWVQRCRLPAAFPLASSPASASASGSRLVEGGAAVGVRSGCLLRSSAKESAHEVPDGMVWGVRRCWVGVTGRRSRRRFLWGDGRGV